MTREQDETEAPTEANADTDAAEQADTDAEAKDDDDEKDEEKDEDDEKEEEEDDDEDDEKSSKREKPKKVKINFEAAMPRNEAVSYFEAIVGGLRSGRIEFKQDGETLVLSPPEHLEVEVKAQAKGDKAKIVFEIEWSDRLALEIKN